MSEARSYAGVDRSLLDGVLAVVRALGARRSLQETFDLILDGIVNVVGFGAAAINVATPDGDLRVDAVTGPPGVERLLGTARPLPFWRDVLDTAEPWGALRFFGHERDQALVDQFTTWTPDRPAGPEPDSWHPDDSLLAPMWSDDGELVGVISVDEPRTGRRPDAEQRTILEAFAAQAAKAIIDAQARQAEDAERRAVEGRWRLAFEHSPTGMALVSSEGTVLEVNDALVALLGRSRDELLLKGWREYTHPDDVDRDSDLFAELIAGQRTSYQMEKRFLRGDGTTMWASLHVGAADNEGTATKTIVSQVVDITERRLAADRLAHQRTHDLLTDLPNRTGLAEEITRLLTIGRSVGVLFCDIDRFKTVNNGLGRDAGDELLVAIAARLVKALPAHCVVGRVSGDEFAVLVPDESRPSALVELGEAINGALDQPVDVHGMTLRMGMTIGSAVSTPEHRTGDDLMREAEQSLAAAKQHTRGGVGLYDPATSRLPTRADLQLEQDLRDAVENGTGLTVFLQPIVNLQTGAIIGAESLLRWRHPTRGTLLPDAVLPIAEQSGLIVPLGQRMLELGVAAASVPWMRARGWVAVNVSGSQLGRGLLPDAVRAALATRDIEPEALHLEITEAALAHASARAIDEVHEITEFGVSIALDDFGTGYSSLSLLRDLPISIVKIDRSFIAPVAKERRAAALVRSLVAMCDSLDIYTVAEGVETLDQRAVVSALGCDHAQGYLFGRPVDVAELAGGVWELPEPLVDSSVPVRRPRPAPGPSAS